MKLPPFKPSGTLPLHPGHPSFHFGMGHLSQVRSAFYFVGSFSHLHCWAGGGCWSKDCVNFQGCPLWLYIAYIANSLQKTNLKNDGNTKKMTNQVFGLISRYFKGAFYQAKASLTCFTNWWPPMEGFSMWWLDHLIENNCWSTWKTILQYCRWKWTKSVSKQLSIKNRSLNKTSNQFEHRILIPTLSTFNFRCLCPMRPSSIWPKSYHCPSNWLSTWKKLSSTHSFSAYYVIIIIRSYLNFPYIISPGGNFLGNSKRHRLPGNFEDSFIRPPWCVVFCWWFTSTHDGVGFWTW